MTRLALWHGTCPNKLTLQRGLAQVARDTMHWKMVPDSSECVAELYEGLHRLVARKERVHLSRKKGWTGSIVPHAFYTIKSKCHDQSAMRRGRTCQKPGHSCKRKIISWWHHPARPKLRAAGRAAAARIECLRVSWECTSMKNSCSDLRRLWSRACLAAGFAEFRRANMELQETQLPGHVPACTARLRYVDDQVWISATDCHACVEKQLREVYPVGVEFSPTSNGTNKAEWLDIVVVLNSDGSLDLSPKQAELEWTHKSDVPCGRHLVPPFVNHLSLDWRLLRGMVKCRCARLLQMCLPKEALREALRHEVPVWRRSGYDTRLITQPWSRLWKYPVMEKYVCAYVAGHCPRIRSGIPSSL